jgi:hypothetical protein
MSKQNYSIELFVVFALSKRQERLHECFVNHFPASKQALPQTQEH